MKQAPSFELFERGIKFLAGFFLFLILFALASAIGNSIGPGSHSELQIPTPSSDEN